MDRVDQCLRYLEHSDMSEWNQTVRKFFAEVLFLQPVPEQGWIVELGTFRCASFQLLCQHFGLERCVGYDVINYANHPRVIEKDVRSLGPEDDRPIAIGWNDVSDWKHSPKSKAAGADYLLRNMVVGGFYIDEDLASIPKDLDLAQYELVFSQKYLSLFRRFR